MKNILLVTGILIVAMIAAAGIILGFYLGPIAKAAIEQVGPRVTQTSITLDAMDLSLLTGSAMIKGLVIGNPQGYTTAEAFNVGTVAISLDPLSVTSQKVLIRSIHVESPQITYEGRLSASNLNKILENVNSFVKANPQARPSHNTGKAGKPAPRIEVDDFLITGAVVHVNISGIVSRDISLPDIHLTGLGKGSDGLTGAELASAILKAITRGTLAAVTSTVGGLGKTLGSTVDRIASGLGGLF